MVEPMNTKAWVMVPSDPTTEMIGAATRVDFDNEDEVAMTINLWHAMLSASPALPAVDGGAPIEVATHLANWLDSGFDHCHYGSREWCEGYLKNAAEVVRSYGAKQQDVERLIKTYTEMADERDRYARDWSAAESRVQSLEEEVKVLREALKPFGEESLFAGPQHEFVTVRLSLCDAARTALKENGNG